jgi:hypothetical protein
MRNRLYSILTACCAAGYVWLFYNMWKPPLNGHEPAMGVCLIRQVTSVPCPSCGSTQFVMHLLRGEYAEALYWNPLGMVILPGLVMVPLWIMFDLVARKDTLFRFYRTMEKLLKKPWVAIPLVVFVLAIWVWNIAKGL